MRAETSVSASLAADSDRDQLFCAVNTQVLAGNRFLADWENLTISCKLQLIVGWHCHACAVRASRRGTADMDVLFLLQWRLPATA